MRTHIERIPNGSVTSPSGFLAAATACKLKKSGGLDLALIFSSLDCCCAGVFTRNKVVAAPVIVDRETLATNSTHLRGVVVNAGVANACTGPAGLEAARATQRLAAEAFECTPEQVLVLSTGLIGAHLDMTKVADGIENAVHQLSPAHGASAARAIMTTDTRPKHSAIRLSLPDGMVTIGGIAKGSGMIHPDMATMLAMLTTDAAIPAQELDEMLRGAVNCTFNCISVDGDTSTNDTVLLLANGASGVVLKSDEERTAFAEALTSVCVELAQAIVRDAEGASKFVTLRVTHARTDADALYIARTIATSPLVKTAFAGGDPNWGRIIAAAGRAGVDLNPDSLSLWIGREESDELQVVSHGASVAYDEGQANTIFASPEFIVHLDLGLAESCATLWTCDLTHEYITINAEYRT